MTQLLEAIDTDHSDKLKKIVTSLDTDHTTKLQGVVEHYETIIATDAKALTESLQVDISNFLDLAIDDIMPKNMLKEAVANTKAADKLQKIQELVSVDDAFINNHIKEALEDGKRQIESLRGDLNEVMKENLRISADRKKVGSELVLERKTKSLPTEKKLFLEQTFKGKSEGYINENFDYTIKMFERREAEVMSTEKAQVLEESVASKVDTPKEKESIADAKEYSYVSEYVSGLK